MTVVDHNKDSAPVTAELDYKLLLESFDAFSWCVDTTYDFSYISPKCLELFGYDPDTLMNKSLLSLLSQDCQTELNHSIQNAIAHKHLSLDWIHEVKNSHGLMVSCLSLVSLIYSDSGDLRTINGFTRINPPIYGQSSSPAELLTHQKIIDIMPIPVFFKDLSGIIISCNKAMADFFSCEKIDLLGKTTAEIVTFSDSDKLDVEQEYHKLITGEVTHYENIERHFTDNMGTRRHVLHSKTLSRNAQGEPESVIVAMVDQTKNHNLESKLWEELNFNMLILETAESLIMVLDNDRHILRFNSACETTSGFMLTEVIGTYFEDKFTLDEDSERIGELLSQYESSMIEHGVVLQYLTADGSKKTVSWSFASIEDDGVTPCILAVGNDITEQRKAEQESVERQKMLVQADKLTSLGTLVAGVAHEINNPNNFIMFNAPQLEDIWEELEPVMRGAYSSLPEQVDNMDYDELNDVVHDLFKGINMGSGRIKQIVKNLKNYVQDKPVDLAALVSIRDVVGGACILLGSSIRTSTDNFLSEIEEDLPEVRGDIGMIEQVLINLIQNACHALPSKQSALAVKAYSDMKNKSVIIEVSDEGRGIAEQAMKFITDPFFTTKRDSGGTGLGLSISNNIMKEHGGELIFSSTLGKGTIVKMVFPVVD